MVATGGTIHDIRVDRSGEPFVRISNARQDALMLGSVSCWKPCCLNRIKSATREEYMQSLEQARHIKGNDYCMSKAVRVLKASDARTQARRLSRQVFDSWKTLTAILERREGQLRKRWTKKTREQRRKVLQASWRNISLSHRPDLAVLGSGKCYALEASTMSRSSLLLPSMNLEDLSGSTNLLMLLNARGHNLPEAFVHFDLESTHLARVQHMLTADFLNGHTMFLAGRTTAETYGEIVSWGDSNNAYRFVKEQTQFMVGDGLLVLELQDLLYSNLVEVCYRLFHDVPKDELALKGEPLQRMPPPMSTTETSYVQLSAIAAEAPFKTPSTLEPSRLKRLLEAKRADAIDHMWDLREDPGYFSTEIETEMTDCTHFNLRVSPHDAIRRVHRLCPDLVAKVVIRAQREVVTFDELLRQMTIIEQEYQKFLEKDSTQSKLPAALENALLDVLYIVEGACEIIVEDLKRALAVSPGFIHNFKGISPNRDHEKTLTFQEGVKGDRFLKLCMYLVDEKAVHRNKLPNLVDEIQRSMDDDSSQMERLSASALARFSDLALFSQIQMQIHAMYHWSAAFPGKLNLTSHERWCRSDMESVDIRQVCDAIRRCPVIALYGDPDKNDFRYPAHRRMNEANTVQMQQAEQNLKRFWQSIDKYCKVETGVDLFEVLAEHGVIPRPIYQTPDWIAPVRPQRSLEAEKLEYAPHLTSTPMNNSSTNMEVITPKVKVKTRGNSDRSDSISPVSRTPESDDSTMSHVHCVSKRAAKTFSSFFHRGSSDHEDTPGEIPWTDFLHAMTSLGFGAEKRYGSVWQFTPTADTKFMTPIHFHEPHPRAKIRWVAARRMGRRLMRNYGLSAESFTTAKEAENLTYGC